MASINLTTGIISDSMGKVNVKGLMPNMDSDEIALALYNQIAELAEKMIDATGNKRRELIMEIARIERLDGTIWMSF